MLRNIIDIYGINIIIFSTNLTPYSLEYEAGNQFLPSYNSKVARHLVPAPSLLPHFFESSRRERIIGIPAMALRGFSEFLSSKCSIVI